MLLKSLFKAYINELANSFYFSTWVVWRKLTSDTLIRMSSFSMVMPANKLIRRRVLQGIGAGSVASLAGCALFDDDDDDFEPGETVEGLGERVPEPLILEYWTGLGGITAVQEACAPIIQENIDEALGLELEINGRELASQQADVANDARTHHIGFWFHTLSPDRLDPELDTRRIAIDMAGNNGQSNPPNYASCEYSNYAIQQQDAGDPDHRRELVYSAHETASRDFATLPLFPTATVQAYHPHLIEAGGIAERGMGGTNQDSVIFSTPNEGDSWIINTVPEQVETVNFPTSNNNSTLATFNRLIHSPLSQHNEHLEIENVLAERIEPNEDATEIVVELIDDAVFHDGSEVMAEDVQFTFQHLWDNTGAFPLVSNPGYTSIDILDDKTVQFNFESPAPAMMTAQFTQWGIFHSESWIEGGAPNDPEGFSPDELIGSGPFEMSNIVFGEAIDLDPAPVDHPVFDVDHSVTLEVFRDTTTAMEAFFSEEIDVVTNLAPEDQDRLADNAPDAEVEVTEGFMPYILYPQCSNPPTHLPEFRGAIGACLDRALMVEVAMFDLVDPQLYSTQYQEAHPFRPPEDRLTQMSDDPMGNHDLARQRLEEAGWGWDEEGNLRYPEDADTEPPWPEGEVPQPDDFDCISAPNEFTPTEDLL